MQTATVAQTTIDVTGKTITTYIVYEAAIRLREMEEGDVIEIITDDFPGIETDMRAWCRMSGQVLERVEREPHRQHFYIRKAPHRELERILALVISNPGLEDLLSPLGFALAGALSGVDVHIYFQGPAVEVLTKDFQAHLHGIGRPFSRFARSGMAEAGHVPPGEKLGQLAELGAHFYICAGSMDHYGTKEEDIAFDNVTIAEYFTFMEVMTRADIHIFLQ